MARPPSVRRNRTQADEKRLFLGGRGLSRPSYRVSGWGNPLAPSPCARAAPAQPSCGRGYGGTWFPHIHVRPHARGAHRPMQTARERGRPARVASPRAKCPRSRPRFTSAVHAAPPHNAVMNIRLFLGGLRPPKPSQGPGPGCAGLRPASAEGWGNPVSPPPSPRAYVHVSACGAAAPLPPSPRWGEEPDSRPQRGRAREGAITFVATDGRSNRKVGKPGSLLPCARAAPSQTLLRAGRWGNPVPPYPCARAAPSQPSCGRGDDGGTRFPPTPARGRSPPKPSRERPGFICGTCAARRLRLPTTCQR